MPACRSEGNGTKAPVAWAQIIDDYMLTLAAAGQPPTTTELRRIQLVRMAKTSAAVRPMLPGRSSSMVLSHCRRRSKPKDIGWALAGIAVDAVGIVVQLCA